MTSLQHEQIEHHLTTLRGLLAARAPFSSLPTEQRNQLAAAAQVLQFRPGDMVLDGFADPSSDVYMVLAGKVGLWHEVESRGHPDDTEERGAFFGFSAMLTGRSVGPRARALSDAVVARIPGPVADAAFQTPAGARFLTEHLLSFADRARNLPGFATVGALVDQEPTVVDADTPLVEVGRMLTERRQPGVVVQMPDASYGLVTDGSIRRLVLAEGLSRSAPASECLSRGVPVVQAGDSAGEVLIEILGAQTDAAIVTDRHGHLAGVVGLREFSLSPTTADVALHEQLRLAGSADELVERARQTPEVLSSLLYRGLSADKVIRVLSGLVDIVVRRALHLCFEQHPELPMEGFTWLALGSNGRREAVLSSDIESAVAFPDGTPEHVMDAYRAVFADVDRLLARAGFAGDDHGVSARHRILARTVGQWREAASGWLADPARDKGAIMISLLVDSRTVFGEPLLAETTEALNDLRRHPVTMRLLLNDALAERARHRQWDAPWRRSSTIDIKHDAVTPLVNLARWVGLAVHSGQLTTPDRLRAAAGTSLLTTRQGPVLAEAFEVLQRVRLRHQLMQWRRGEQPSDLIDVDALSPIDRSILGEAVREISQAQKRLGNVAAWSDTDDWQLGRP